MVQKEACKVRKMLENYALVAKIGVDTVENGPSEVELQKLVASGKHAHKYFYNERIFMSTENENGEEVYAYLKPKPVVMAERLGCGGGTGATTNQEEAVFVDFMSSLLFVDDEVVHSNPVEDLADDAQNTDNDDY